MDKAYTVRQVAERLSVSVDTVRIWIKSRQLRAVLVSSSVGNARKRYVVRGRDLEAFEAVRLTTPAPRERRRAAPRAGVVDYFPDR